MVAGIAIGEMAMEPKMKRGVQGSEAM